MFIDIGNLMYNVYPITDTEFSLKYDSILYGSKIHESKSSFEYIQELILESKEFSIEVIKGDTILIPGDKYILFKEDEVLRPVSTKNHIVNIQYAPLRVVSNTILELEDEIKKDTIQKIRSSSIDYLTHVIGNCQLLIEGLADG